MNSANDTNNTAIETGRTLLLKVRKGATSGFGPKDWKVALERLGFKAEVIKTGREITGFSVVAPNGATLDIKKEPRYRCITFYDLGRWLKDQGYDMEALASTALGLPTPEVEKANKKLYERDLTNTGTCGVCGGNFKRDSEGDLVKHGYERPGDGYLHGECFGVRYQPFELSAESVVDFLARVLRPLLAKAEEYLARVPSITSFTVEGSGRWENGKWVHPKIILTAANDPYRFGHEMKMALVNAENNVRRLQRDVKEFEGKVANWKLDVLPEVKHAGLFKKA